MSPISRRWWMMVSLFLSLGTVPQGAAADLLATNNARRVSLDADWRFLKADADGAERPAFVDASWRSLDVPHDWAIEGPFDKAFNPQSGALPYSGIGWYRKHFTLPASARGRQLEVVFDGAMANAHVWLNGHELGARPHGYISFGFDLTPYVTFGSDENVLAVRLAPEPDSSRWYPGAGLYRHVWLDVTDPVHVARWGTYITTPAVDDQAATVRVRTTLDNAGTEQAVVSLETAVLDASGSEIVRSRAVERTLAPDESLKVDFDLALPNPIRWDIDRPYLYRAVSVVRDRHGVRDRSVSSFGVRTIAFDKTKGFSLNGRRLKLHGVCLHHDLGALGTAVNRRAIERQLHIMKAMGVNAIRTSHNPPAPELLDLADSMGLVVMDEAFDMWSMTKVKNGHGKYFAEWGERDLRDMIRRDRNHPSIVLWSIGNEILEQASPTGGAVAARLTAICHEEDPTRPATAGFNQFDGAIKNGLAAAVDVPAFNYQARRYAEVVRDHPDWPFFASETSSAVSSRGVYHLPLEKYEKHPSHQITSYDVIAPEWAYIPDFEFTMQERVLQVMGEFVWTGFDYLGEPTPYYGWREPADPNDWPARSSYFGIVDLAGFPKDRYYLYQSVWTQAPMVHLLPHWNWAGHEGEPIPVIAYSNADQVELFLNGTSLGRKTMGAEPMRLPVGRSVSDSGTFDSRYRLRWDVPYHPGALRAVAYRGGQSVAEQTVRTAGAPSRIVLTPDHTLIAGDGKDLSFVTVRIEDRDGNFCPTSDAPVHFAVSGPGSIAAVDNGDPATLEPFQADHRAAFNGLALVVLRSTRGASGVITIEGASPGLQPGRASVRVGK
jgi:beta-galactosidase